MTVDISNKGQLEIGAILQSFKSTLDEIDKKLKKEVISRFDTEFQVGQICAVRMGAKWFRAKIMENFRSEFFVELIDYGRVDSVRKENMAKLPDSAFLFPALHVKILIEDDFGEKSQHFRNEVENMIIGRKVAFEITQHDSGITWRGRFENIWREKIEEKFGVEAVVKDPYVDMDPFSIQKPLQPSKTLSPNGPTKRSPHNSTGDSGILRGDEKDISTGDLPELFPIKAGKRHDIRYGRYLSSVEISVIITDESEKFEIFEEKIQQFCQNGQCVEKIKSLDQLYAVKLPTNKWVRAIVNEKLTAKDAEMELIDKAQLRRCHVDQIVELPRYEISTYCLKLFFDIFGKLCP